MASPADDLIADIAAQALETPASERGSFLATACGDDVVLRERVEVFVSKAEAAEQFFGGLVDRVGLRRMHEPSEMLPAERRLGAYRLIERIGEGGMGQVYRAERVDDQFEQQVAIKILPSRFASDTLKSRFIAERQILARLAHPNIARLLDGGVDDQGSPFIVMEHVAGTRIDEYCNRQAMTIDERLHLFTQVCDAVGYAHRNLVVHRDLKPSNVLVDEDGVVKLLDFGIAKLLEDDASQELTRTGLHPMTLRYASPEMIRGETIGTASDVYGLGVLLYELIVGASPYSNAPLSDAEILSAISAGDITTPSRAIASLTGSDPDRAMAFAQERSASIDGLRKELKGDLEAILLKALQLNPERRYPSPQAIDDELARYRDDLPVEARSATFSYTMAKLIRRHTLAAALMTASAISLVVIALLATAYSITTSRQAEVIAQERDRAEATQSFLLSLFEVSSPNESKGENASAKELLDRGAERIDRELADQPGAAALMKETIAGVYEELGLYDSAEALLQDALALRGEHNGKQSAEYAAGLERLALRAEVAGDFDRGLTLAREALVVAEHAGDRHVIAQVEMRIGRILHVQGLLHEVQPHYEAAREGLAETTGARSAETSMVIGMMAGLQGHLGNLEEAERLHQESIANYRTLFGDQHIETIGAMIAYGQTLKTANKYEASVEVLQTALAHNTKLLGADHRDNFFIYNTMASALMELDRLDEAEAQFERARAIVLDYFGDQHASYAYVLQNLGALAARRGDCVTALTYYADARPVFESSMAGHWAGAILDGRVGHCEMQLGNYDAAERFLTQGAERLRTLLGDGHARTRQVFLYLAELYEKLGRNQEAAAYRQLIAATPDSH